MQGLPRPSTTYRRVAVLRTILPESPESGVCASAGLRRQGRAGPMSVTASSGRRMRAIVASDFVHVVAWPPPNGSRLSCGRLARRRKGRGRQPVPRQGHNTPLPLKRSPPASFKRLLGGLGGTIEEVYHTRPQTVLGTDHQ